MTEDECPHCGQFISDLWEYFMKDEDAFFDCPHCDNPINGTRHVSYTLRKRPTLEKEETK